MLELILKSQSVEIVAVAESFVNHIIAKWSQFKDTVLALLLPFFALDLILSSRKYIGSHSLII
jgi:hypothetical protein